MNMSDGNEKLRNLIDFYVQNETAIHFNQREGYKWDILTYIRDEVNAYVKRHYRNGEWDQDFSDFHDLIRKTLGKTGNLVYSSARSVMQNAADKYPQRVRRMLIDLSGIDSETGSEASLEERVRTFIGEIDAIAAEDRDVSKSGNSFHRDFRSVSVYLLMMDPTRNYNYMYGTFSEFARFTGIKIPRAGSIKLLPEYYRVCDEIKGILERDYKDWFEDYLQVQRSEDPANERRADICGHLLVQDIIYSLYYYNKPEVLSGAADDVVKPTRFKKTPVRRVVVPGDGAVIDYEARQRENTAISAAAENFVLENERRLVAGYGLDPGRVRHISKEQGDGLGYDILSCDKHGKEIFIEVKGTRGGMGTPFYITETELQCSIQNAEKYRLYRVYDFRNAGTIGRGKIAMIVGSLEAYCLNPVAYKAVFR